MRRRLHVRPPRDCSLGPAKLSGRAGCGFAPLPERARGGGSAGARREGARWGLGENDPEPATWAPAAATRPLSPQAPSCADARRSPVLSPRAASLRRGREVPGRVPAARRQARRASGPRQAARRRRVTPRRTRPPRPTRRRRRPLAPQPVRPPPADSPRFPLAKLLGLFRRAPHRPSGRRAGRPSRPPRFFT